MRLTGWELLTEQRQLSLPLDAGELGPAKLALLTGAAEQDAAARYRILTGLRKLFYRFRDSAQAAFKEEPQPDLLPLYTVY